ncbi:hypothetical protein BGZ76_003645, partial [Entomortierella beljakovae]
MDRDQIPITSIASGSLGVFNLANNTLSNMLIPVNTSYEERLAQRKEKLRKCQNKINILQRLYFLEKDDLMELKEKTCGTGTTSDTYLNEKISTQTEVVEQLKQSLESAKESAAEMKELLDSQIEIISTDKTE